jgi:hypothetical protein
LPFDKPGWLQGKSEDLLKEIEKKWGEVAKRRLADLRSGKGGAIPGQDVFGKIWKPCW